MALRRDHELHGRRRGRNLGVLLALLALIVLLFAVTVVKVGPGFGNPTSGESWGQAMLEWLSGARNQPIGEPAVAPVPGAIAPDAAAIGATASPAGGGVTQ